MLPPILCGDNLSLDAPLPEPRTYDEPRQSLQFLGNVLWGDLLAVDELDLHLHVIVDACQVQTLTDTLVSILQVVLAHQSDVDHLGGFALLVEEGVPCSHSCCVAIVVNR